MNLEPESFNQLRPKSTGTVTLGISWVQGEGEVHFRKKHHSFDTAFREFLAAWVECSKLGSLSVVGYFSGQDVLDDQLAVGGEEVAALVQLLNLLVVVNILLAVFDEHVVLTKQQTKVLIEISTSSFPLDDTQNEEKWPRTS